MFNALITGSQVYGKPREDSDLDIVLLLPERLIEKIQDFYGTKARSITLGMINLILTSNPVKYNNWQEGTEFLKKSRFKSQEMPTREAAMNVFRLLGIPDEEYNPAAKIVVVPNAKPFPPFSDDEIPF